MAKRKCDPRLGEVGLSPEVRTCIDSLVELFPMTPYPERITVKGGEIWDEGQIVNAALVNRSWLEVTSDVWDELLCGLLLCFMDEDAIAYFLPGMLRVALIGNPSGWISATLDLLMMHDDERRRNLLGHFNPAQLACIVEARRLIRLAEGQPDEE
ncbi:MAG TPA: hypothetical protein VHE55_10350 [Fimbriimonadaceae bacterium]|nr:hypothetical protein [Fimbriimonadaceae bacterium]